MTLYKNLGEKLRGIHAQKVAEKIEVVLFGIRKSNLIRILIKLRKIALGCKLDQCTA